MILFVVWVVTFLGRCYWFPDPVSVSVFPSEILIQLRLCLYWQTVFSASCYSTFFEQMLLYPKQGTNTQMCHDWNTHTFDYSQGHFVTKNQPVAVSA